MHFFAHTALKSCSYPRPRQTLGVKIVVDAVPAAALLFPMVSKGHLTPNVQITMVELEDDTVSFLALTRLYKRIQYMKEGHNVRLSSICLCENTVDRHLQDHLWFCQFLDQAVDTIQYKKDGRNVRLGSACHI